MSKASGLTLAVLVGVAAAAQARINGELGRRLDDGIAAAAVSFVVGMVILIFLLPWILPGLRKVGSALRTGSLRWWQTLGGLCGAFFISAQGLTVASIGVAVFTVAVVAGQSASSLVVDRAGLAPGGARPLTFPRVVGAALCIVAVIIAVSDRLGDARAIGLAALPAIAGIGVAWQQGMNGFVRQAGDGALTAAFVNFAVGTVVLLAIVSFRGMHASLPAEPWLYLGGPIGVAFIAVAAAVVPRIGVLLLGLGTIAGQIVGAVLVDVIAPTVGPPDLRILLGTALALAAVALATRR